MHDQNVVIHGDPSIILNITGPVFITKLSTKSMLTCYGFDP